MQREHRGGVSTGASRPRIAGLLLTIACVAAAGCNKAADPKSAAAKPVALVGTDTVTVGDVATYMGAANLNRTLAARDSAVEDLIAVQLVKLAAKDEPLTPEQEAQKKDWESQLRLSQFRDSVIAKSVTVPDSVVQAYYDQRVSEEIKARHVLIPLGASPTAEEKEAAHARAEEVLKKARAGDDFEKLSREYSEPKTAEAGGDLGWFGKGDMVPAFERAAFALKPGEISDVVETRFGYHVIKVEDRRRKTLEEAKPDIVRALEGPLKRQAEERYLENMMAESGLQFYEANVDTMVAIFDQDSVGVLPPSREGLPIAKWNEGQLTVGDIVALYHGLPKENQAAVKALDRDRMLKALTPLVRNRMLLSRAEATDLKLDPDRQKMLDERLESVKVTEMLRQQVKKDAVVTDSTIRTAWGKDSTLYAGKTLAEAEPEIREAMMGKTMQRVNSPAGQRELVHEIAKGMEGKVEVRRFPENYELVLAQLAPADSARAAATAEAAARAGTGAQPAGVRPGVPNGAPAGPATSGASPPSAPPRPAGADSAPPAGESN
jgi:parvulin-like peptidyl-prolyl isomerase